MPPDPPTLNGPYDLTSLEEHERFFQDVLVKREKLEELRIAPPEVRMWDGDYTLRDYCAGWRSIEYEFIENDTGTATLHLSLSHHLAKWVMNFRGRAKRNVHITIDKQGSRWSGIMDHFTVVRTEQGDKYLEVVFKHDYEQAKHILCWANPFLRPELQFPKLWVLFGPAKWCLLMTLFVNILRLETSLWTLPDNPLDPSEWFPLSLNVSNWRNLVKPFPLLDDNSNLTLVFSRFKSWHDVAQKTLEDAQLTVVCRRYLKGDPHPFENMKGVFGLPLVEDLFQHIPIRHGCLIWDIEDKSAWGQGTVFGGSLLTGFVRALVNIADDGYTESIDVFTGDPTSPSEYYNPRFMGTAPGYPWAVFDAASPYTGVKSSKFTYYEATATSFLTGGQSMPGVNEAISAGVNMAGDFLTSLINTAIGANPGAALGSAIDLPPLGGIMDALAQMLYKDVFLAFEEVPTLRAAGTQGLPIPGLEDAMTGLGDFHLYEDWADGATRAFTIAAQMAVRARIWKTRAHSTHEIHVDDAAPYLLGEKGYGHLWLGDRAGSTVPEFPIPHTVFVERLKRIKYKWDQDGPKGWMLTLGHVDPKDPALKALDWIKEINQAAGTMGIL
ncbi:phage tail protein [Mycobacterium scrofulaceum]|uniref:Phage tail protein n=1 Tax=Mycobacterium scrofulaceum TaxID=1783 RepID=A0A1X0KF13_MYCSC|nr:phage tail protein [Mycobacterium scrofulaceum]